MSLRDPARSGGINGTAEWRLMTGLRENSDRFSLSERVAPRSDSRRVLKLLNAIRNLDVQIRKTFTILRLDLLLYLELEIDDDTSQTSSGSETDRDSGWASSDSDEDDVSSQSSIESHRTSQRGRPCASPGLPPPRSEAFSYLQELCSLLEARVNPLLLHVEQGDRGQTRHYPRLTQLIQHLRSSPSLIGLDFIPTDRSTSTEFLFNIAEDTTTANAFVAFRDPNREQSKDILKRMLTEASFLGDRFSSFNRFVDKLQISTASLDDFATRPSENSGSNQSFASFTLFRKFYQQITAARSALVSQFSSCASSQSVDHRILLQLPGWDDVSNLDSTVATENLSIQLFFTVCSHSKWQAARMYFLPPEHIKSCIQQKLCNALRSSYDNDRDLVFYVPEYCKRAGGSEIPIHVPIRLDETRVFGASFPNHKQSLWTMIKQGYFARRPSLSLSHSTDGTGTILEIDQRKALATKLVLGLMVCLDSNGVFKSWDPKRIHFLDPVDAQRTPFVSITRKEGSSSQERPLLAELCSCSGVEDYLEPLPQFMSLAKALLQIASGERLESVKIRKSSDDSDFLNMWKSLRKTLKRFIDNVTCEPEVDLQILPFLRAAKGCLEFHIEYQSRLSETQSSQKIDLARKLVFDTILVEIDDSLILKEVIESSPGTLTEQDPSPVARHSVVQETPVSAANASTQQTPSGMVIIQGTLSEEISFRRYGAPTTQPSQPNVALFDAKEGMGLSTAGDFWKLLDEFHRSYSKFVTDRTTDPEKKSPQRIRIAVLDTGVDFDHSGIKEAMDKGRMKKEWCHSWVGADAKDDDNELHGTNCAYLLHKVAPEADIYVEKVFKKNAVRTYEAMNIAKAIEHAANKWNVDIISMSFGLRRPTAREDGNKDEERLALEEYTKIVDDIEDAIQNASTKSPRLMFAAASNSGKNESRAFPASYSSSVFCVHASEGNGEDGGINPEMEGGFNFMTLGMGLDLFEKEETITKGGREFPKYKSVVKSGTSFATPIAAGIAATVLDLAARVEAIKPRARKKLKRPDGMEKMLRIMSTPKNDVQHRLYYMAPWHHWKRGWQMDESERRLVWDTINNKLS